MITGSHVLLYAKDAVKARAFFRDVLGFRHVDAGEGWLIFALPPAELGVHPSSPDDPRAASGVVEHHLMCDDVERTVADLRSKGVEIKRPVSDQGYGLVTSIEVPGFGTMGLYQPRHPTAHAAAASSTGKAAPKQRNAAKKVSVEKARAKRVPAKKASAKRAPAKVAVRSKSPKR